VIGGTDPKGSEKKIEIVSSGKEKLIALAFIIQWFSVETFGQTDGRTATTSPYCFLPMHFV
jgi:hypothetical protein